MKKIVALLIMVVACLSLTFAACEIKPATDNGLKNAKAYLTNMYIDEATATASDYTRTSVLTIDGKKFDVAWSVEIDPEADVADNYVEVVANDEHTVKVAVHQTVDSLVDVNYDLIAVIKAADGSTTSVTWNRYVPKFQVSTYEAFVALDDGELVVVDGIVTGIISKSLGDNNNCLYIQDVSTTPVKGGFYVYDMTNDPIADGIQVGQTVRVKGAKATYSGTLEVKNSSVTVTDETIKTVAPIDLTSAYQAASDLTDKALVGGQAMLVTIKGVQITGQDTSNGYYRFKLGELESYIRISSTVCPLNSTETEAFKMLHSSSFGYTADVTGVVCVYNGAFYLTPVSVDAISNVQLPERTPAEQVAVEKENLTITAKITNPSEITLVATGISYTDVKISWVLETETDCASISEGKLITTYPEHNTEIKLIATLTLGEGDDAITDTKEITTVVRAEEKELTEAEILQQAFALEANDYINGKQVLRGEIVRIDNVYDTYYKNITVTIKVGAENKEIKCFRLKGEGADTLAVGDVITVTGTIKNYNGTVEFDSGCTFSKTLTVEEAQDIVILERAYELEKNKSLSGTQVVTGKITEIKTEYDTEYKNITVIIGVGDKTIEVFRLKGEGADTLAVGDVITVTGTIKNYNGTVEFDSGCTFVLVAKGGETGCDHDWDDGEVTTSATCTTDGVRTYTCSKCSLTKTEKIDAAGHTDIDNNNVCDVCNADLSTSTDKGTKENPYTVAEALEIAGTLGANEYSANAVYVQGIIKSYSDNKSSNAYQMYIVDINNSASELLVYTCYYTDDVKAAYINDTVIVYGYLQNYSGTTLEITKKDPQSPQFIARTAGTSSISVATTSSDKATVALSANSGLNGSTFTFTVTVTTGYEMVSVKVNGTAVTAVEGVYSGTIAGPTTVLVETKEEGAADQITETLTFIAANRTSQDTQQQTWKSGAIELVNKKGSSTSNVADYTDPARFYKSSSLEISCVGMTKIVFKCSSNDYASSLKNSISGDGLTVSISGSEVTVIFSSKVDTFKIDVLSGQVRVKSLEVSYIAE